MPGVALKVESLSVDCLFFEVVWTVGCTCTSLNHCLFTETLCPSLHVQSNPVQLT